MTLAICNKCGWAHFSVTREYAQTEVLNFNSFFDNLSDKLKKDYYGGRKSSIRTYEHCALCRESYKNFRVGTKEDAEKTLGCTLSPIINDKE